ncbi:MAG: hypothetical protein A3B90_00890 [Candidatus Magasanikbacteria bacterium RIFCSPHIGHO2_02_FULL_41_13]|uniref:SCP domain-containing protein n=1 Tax=Candidatus Magasanikbacteria bacterium RIFCSPHIGHO2_02_FULL_41_13 TaxID=1798676 RepID=A0A1F6M4P4_9BACT|nr:MAG: hypothetical protein A3B90_00890 [Candidatus Magasanikbacteria bacterium RIFCSPHIGHO2_02_FULL_41_13]
MVEHLKHFFIPHEGNNYHPHILHSKRAIFYSTFFLGLKAMVFLFAMLLPSVVFVMPDLLAGEENKLLTLTNNLRIRHGVAPMSPIVPLHVSSDYKASDMADLHYFSHRSPNGYGLAHYLSLAGYNYEAAGENLAMGFSSAEEVFSSWVKSPTHYANLIDPDFKEFGVSMESGTYNDLATVYVAQHFGAAKTVEAKAFPESVEKIAGLKIASVETQNNDVVTSTSLLTTSSLVLASLPDIALAATPIFHTEPVLRQAHFVSEKSFIDWKEVEKDKTLFSAVVFIEGDVKSASVILNQHSFPLQKWDDTLYQGTLLLSEPVDNFFKPVVGASLKIIGSDGQVTNEVLSWKQIKVVSPSPLEKYIRAKSLPGIPEQIFNFSRGVYVFFLVFFSLALVLSIFIEIRRQHHHIIAQTLGLLVLLATLIIT